MENFLNYYNDLARPIYISDCMAATNNNCFGYYDENTINTPYKANLTLDQRGVCLIGKSNSNLGHFYTVICIPIGETKIFMWSKYTENGIGHIYDWRTIWSN